MSFRNDEAKENDLDFYIKLYDKLLYAARVLAEQSYRDYIDEYEALTEGFWSDADLNAKKDKVDVHEPRKAKKNINNKSAIQMDQNKSDIKSYQDYMQDQTRNPIVVFFELTVHAILSALTIGSGITLDLMTDCQKSRGHLRFWNKVTDDMNNAVNEVNADFKPIRYTI